MRPVKTKFAALAVVLAISGIIFIHCKDEPEPLLPPPLPPPEPLYTIGVKISGAALYSTGWITNSHDSAPAGTTVTITINCPSDYELESLHIDLPGDSFFEPNQDTGTTYTFSMPASDVVVSAVFTHNPVPVTYLIFMAETANGTIRSSPQSQASPGQIVNLSLEPASGYTVTQSNLSVKKTDAGEPVAIYDFGPHPIEPVFIAYFTMPEANVTVYAEFEAIPPPSPYDEVVKKVTFSAGDTETVTFNNLSHNSIYLVKINTSGSEVPAADTGGPAGALWFSVSGAVGAAADSRTGSRDYAHYQDYKPAQEFNANPPPFDRKARRGAAAAIIPYEIGDQKNFWVDTNNGWEQKLATLRAIGEYGNFWVIGTNPILVNNVQTLVSRFDLIYPFTTNIFGYESGGGPDGDGGIDGDKKIQILVYDMGNGGEGGGITAGFFWAKDLYTQEQLDTMGGGYKTNLAEMFYINAYVVIRDSGYIPSVLIHEFQHMIHFNRKDIEQAVSTKTWYTEMLSMLAEDVISPLIGISHTNPYHLIAARIPLFLKSYYDNSITAWNNSLDSYAITYAFGAYLMRNYGGPEFLKKLIDNNKTGVDSITMALKEYSPDFDFKKAINRFGEAMIFSGSSMREGVMTFDKTVTSTINENTYTASGFDIWQIIRESSASEKGPVVLNLNQTRIKPHSVVVQSSAEWKERTGSFSITLEKPSNDKVALYLMVR